MNLFLPFWVSNYDFFSKSICRGKHAFLATIIAAHKFTHDYLLDENFLETKNESKSEKIGTLRLRLAIIKVWTMLLLSKNQILQMALSQITKT